MTELELCILANYPILYVVSPEETRFIEALERICGSSRRKLWIHTISSGLWRIAPALKNAPWQKKAAGDVQTQLKDPVALLEHLKQCPSQEGVFLLLDFQAVIGDPLVQRLLKDVARQFKQRQNSIVILSPVRDLPRALEHEIYLLDFPLPAIKDLSAALESVLATLARRQVAIRLNGSDRERLVSAGQGLTMDEFENCLARAVVQNRGRIDASMIDEITASKKQIVKKKGILEFFDAHETMDQVGGLENLKAWLAKRQRAFTAEAGEYGLPHPKGILLLGIQGCGKSLTAKACAALWKFPLLRLDTGKLFSSRVGGSEENTREAIRTAEALAPCILWIDEIEKAMAGVGSSSNSDAGTAARVFASLATWLQEKTAPVFVFATGNTVAALPPELIRKGRWDEIFFLDLPGLGERQSIISIHLTRRKRSPHEFEIALLAEKCAGFSGAEIEQAVIEGLYNAFDENRPLGTADILRSFESTVPLSITMAESVQALRTWALTRARPASTDKLEEERRKWRSGTVRTI